MLTAPGSQPLLFGRCLGTWRWEKAVFWGGENPTQHRIDQVLGHRGQFRGTGVGHILHNVVEQVARRRSVVSSDLDPEIKRLTVWDARSKDGPDQYEKNKRSKEQKVRFVQLSLFVSCLKKKHSNKKEKDTTAQLGLCS